MSKARRAERFVVAMAMSLALVFAFMPAMGGNAFAEDGVPAPQNVKLNVDTSSAGIVYGYTAEWDAVEGAEKYQVAVFMHDPDDPDDEWSNETNYFDADSATASGGKVTMDLYDFPDYSGTFKIKVIAFDNNEDCSEPGESPAVDLCRIYVTMDEDSQRSATVLDGSSVAECAKEIFNNAAAAVPSMYWIDEAGDYWYNDGEEKHKLVCMARGWPRDYSSLYDMMDEAYFIPPNGDSYAKVYFEPTYVYMFWNNELCPEDGDLHSMQEITHKGSFTENGYTEWKCSKCGAGGDFIIPGGLKVNNVKLEKTSFKCTGKPIKPKVTVANYDGPLAADCYDLIYKNNVNVGTASVTVKLKGPYFEGSKTLTFTITKGVNPLKVSAKTAAVKYSKLKKKAQTLKVSKVIKFANKGQGTLSYKLVSAKKGSKNFKKSFKVAAKTGKVTVKKGLKKGTYKVKVTVKAAGNKNFVAGSKNVTFKVKVK